MSGYCLKTVRQQAGVFAEPLRIGNVVVSNRVFLAPMSGISDLPFRKRAHAAGAGLTVCEMVASGELAKGRAEAERRIQFAGLPVESVQLAGREAGAMAEAARIAAGAGASIIDINMGCPAKKVTGGYCGSALMRDPDHALRLIGAVVGAVDVPVTLKMRLGWDDDTLNAPEIAERAEQAGVQMIAVHGRTRCQFYKGRADWQAIAAVKQAVSVPVVANGDVASLSDLAEIRCQSGADAVMVGRANYGQPWLTGMLARALIDDHGGLQAASTIRMNQYIAEHYMDMLNFYGKESGLHKARKHLGWYLDRHAPAIAPDMRMAIMTSHDPDTVLRCLDAVFKPENHAGLRAA